MDNWTAFGIVLLFAVVLWRLDELSKQLGKVYENIDYRLMPADERARVDTVRRTARENHAQHRVRWKTVGRYAGWGGVALLAAWYLSTH